MKQIKWVEKYFKYVNSKSLQLTAITNYPVAENELNRRFTSSELGQKWGSGITHLKLQVNGII